MYATSAIPAHEYPHTKPAYPLRTAQDDRDMPRWAGEGRWRMVAEERGGYDATPTSDTQDTSDTTETQPAENVTPFPQRTWTQVDNSYYDRVWGKVSMMAWGILGYFHRYALGYHRADVRVSIHELATRAGLAIHTTKKAIHELEDAGLIATNANDCGRTQTRTFILLPETSWLLPERQQSSSRANFALDDAGAARANDDVAGDTRANTAAVGSSARANLNLVEGQTRANGAPHLKKEEKKEQKKETQTDASASGVADSQRDGRAPSGVEIEIIRPAYTHPLIAAELAQMAADLDRATTVATGPIVDADPADEWGTSDSPTAHPTEPLGTPPLTASPPPIAKPATKRPRKLPDEALPAHREEAAWCSALLKAFATEKGLTVLPKEGKERGAAHWYYSQLAGVEDGVGKVIACYRALKIDPYWAQSPVTLMSMQEQFGEYRRNPAAYRKAREAAAAKASHPSTVRRAYAPPEPPSYSKTADDADPWGTPIDIPAQRLRATQATQASQASQATQTAAATRQGENAHVKI